MCGDWNARYRNIGSDLLCWAMIDAALLKIQQRIKRWMKCIKCILNLAYNSAENFPCPSLDCVLFSWRSYPSWFEWLNLSVVNFLKKYREFFFKFLWRQHLHYTSPHRRSFKDFPDKQCKCYKYIVMIKPSLHFYILFCFYFSFHTCHNSLFCDCKNQKNNQILCFLAKNLHHNIQGAIYQLSNFYIPQFWGIVEVLEWICWDRLAAIFL